MRVIVIGGAGDMGQVACRTVATDPKISHVVVADRDKAKAEALAADIGEKSSPLELDVTNEAALHAAIADVDIVLNAVGPFYLFGPPVLRATIAERKHYADIADDWEPTWEMLDLHDEAREAGITAIIGIGASPGISNLLAATAYEQLDQVDSLHTAWRGGSGVPKAPANRDQVQPAAAIEHWIHSLSEPIRLWRNGKYEDTIALESFEIDYPGIGTGQVWTCGHPEPLTLPRTFTDIQNSYNIMYSRPGLIEAARQVRDRVRSGETTVPEGSKDFIMAPGRRGPEAGEVPPYPGIFAYAEGQKDGKPARAVVSANVIPGGTMGEATCIPLAIAAGMIARGEITARGTLPPEAAIDPDIFFERLASFAAPLEGKPVLDIRVAEM